MFLSIIIPCFNVESYLPKTIESLAALEKAEDVEFIFINDGSTDNTLQLIRQFEQQDTRVKVINQKNQGVSTARNNALDIAQGEYILCLDGDDYLEKDTIQIIRYNHQDCDVLFMPNYIVNGGNATLYPIPCKCGRYEISHFFHSIHFFPTAPMLVYRADIIQERHLQFNSNLKAGEVFDFTLSVLEHSSNICVIDKPFYNYVMRQSSATHAPNCAADLTSILLLEHVKHISKDWAQTPSCLFTIYKLINAFTYNKYLRLHASTPDIVNTVDTLLHTASYRQLLSLVARTSKTPLIERLLIAYQLLIPARLGYYVLNATNRIIPLIR